MPRDFQKWDNFMTLEADRLTWKNESFLLARLGHFLKTPDKRLIIEKYLARLPKALHHIALDELENTYKTH
ncbi:hypothetical protein H2248_003001 [Termitomyces sp. 'cryptogamus']|nr:hypothetical protein H2248_003001 [Termitomyces sp. 'cryptogamus']